MYWDTDDLEIHYKTTTKGMNIYYIKALTIGDKAVDYEKVKVTVCGLETFTTSSSDPLFYVYSYSATYAGLSIPWSEILTWYTFNDNSPNSDESCRQ